MNNYKIKWFCTTPDSVWQQLELQQTEAGQDTLEITEDKKQTIEGFGGCFNELGWIALSKIDEETRNKILDEIFLPNKGLNFNFCRIPIGANDYAAEWYSYNETPGDYDMKYFSIERDYLYLIPYIKEAQKRNPHLKFFASPWSPPTWLKFPRAYNFGTLIWKKEILIAYALYFLKFIKAYEKEGIKISQIHIQNEPMSTQKFPSCIWTGEQLREFIRDYIGPLFEKEGVDTKIWLGTLNGPEVDERFLYTRYDDYANLVLSDAEARKYIEGVSYQWAGKYAIQQTHESWPEIKLMQSENECGDGENTWEYARYIFELFRHYFNNGVSYYIYWNMVLEPKGMSTWGWKQNSLITINSSDKNVIYNPEFYVMKHFSHFIKPGAVRLKAKGHWTGNSVVFQNPNDELVVVVGNCMKRERTFSFKFGNRSFNVLLKPNSFNTFIVG